MELDHQPVMYVPPMDAFLNQWFNSYDEAHAVLESDGGYLLPYKHQFFVTSELAIRELGLDPEDPDWQAIGWDWERPRDAEAWERLRIKREIAS